MKKISLLFLCFIIIISKCYASDCCNIPYSEAEFHIKTKNNFNNHLKNLKTKNIEEVEEKLNSLNFQKITKQFNYHNEEGIGVFISTIQNIFRRDCYLNKLNECLEIVRNNIEEIDKDLIYGIYDLLMINNGLFNANSKEETKNIFEKYLTVSELYKAGAEEKVNDISNLKFNANSKEETINIFEKYLTVSELYKIDAEEKVNDISNLKFCDDNLRFIHYKYTQVLIKVLFGLLNEILEIGKKKKIFILDTPYVFSYFEMNKKMNKNEDKIKQKQKEKKKKNENFDEKKKDKTFEKILKGEEDAFESDYFIILLDNELLQECDIYNFSYNIAGYEICGMIKILEELQVGTDSPAIAIVKEENKMNFYDDNEEEIFEYNPLEPWDYRFFNKCLFFEKTDNASLDVNYNSYQYFIDKQKEKLFHIIYRKGKIFATLFEWFYWKGEENKDNPQVLAYSWNKEIDKKDKKEKEVFYKEFFEKIDNYTCDCKLIDKSLDYLGVLFKIEGDRTIERLKKCYKMKINKDENYEKIIYENDKSRFSHKSFLDNFFENYLSHCDLYDASVLYKDLGKKEFFSKTMKFKYLAKTILNGRIFCIYDDDKMKYLEN